MSVVDAPPALEARRPASRVLSRLRYVVAFFTRWLVGGALCTAFVTSVVVVGWTQRLVQRAVLKRWRRGRSQPLPVDRRRLPEWVLAPLAESGPRWTVRRFPRTLLRSVWLNGKQGVLACSNAWIATSPALALWVFAWYAGWNNSFHKGYEQAWVGPTTGILGAVLFAVAMLYVPLALVRQAVTGRWKAFYELRVVRAVVRERWLSCLGLALAHLVLSLPVLVFRTAPALAGNTPELEGLSDAELLDWLNGYWLAGSLLLLFPAYVVLRLFAARVYSSALPRLLKRGGITGTLEGEELVELEALVPVQEPEPTRPWVVRVVAWGGTRVGRFVTTGLSLGAWLAFVFLLFVAEFFNHHPVTGFLVHPLVQAPWFAYVPGHLTP